MLASLKATQNVSIFVTRSNSKLLSGRLASLLACNDFNKVFVAHFIENLVYNELLYRGYDFKIGKTYKGEIDFVTMKDGKKCFIQLAYLLSSYDVIEREFVAFDGVCAPSPKYVFSLDEYDMSKNGIIHFNIEDWLLNKVNITLT